MPTPKKKKQNEMPVNDDGKVFPSAGDSEKPWT